jgi:Rha family phage regulatory protein
MMNLHQLVTLDGDNKLTTNTLKVAAVHGKRHNNVPQITRQRIKEAGAWSLLNFKQTTYTDQQNGQTYPMFTTTKDGYAFLVAKLTGKLAVQHQIEFIEAFNAMADMIASHRDNLWQQMRALIAQEVESKVKASFGSNLPTTFGQVASAVSLLSGSMRWGPSFPALLTFLLTSYHSNASDGSATDRASCSAWSGGRLLSIQSAASSRENTTGRRSCTSTIPPSASVVTITYPTPSRSSRPGRKLVSAAMNSE